jgi:hypothetical protein
VCEWNTVRCHFSLLGKRVSFDDYGYRFAVNFDFMSVCESFCILRARKFCRVAPRCGLAVWSKIAGARALKFKRDYPLVFLCQCASSFCRQFVSNLYYASPLGKFQRRGLHLRHSKDIWFDSVMIPRVGKGMCAKRDNGKSSRKAGASFNDLYTFLMCSTVF